MDRIARFVGLCALVVAGGAALIALVGAGVAGIVYLIGLWA